MDWVNATTVTEMIQNARKETKVNDGAGTRDSGWHLFQQSVFRKNGFYAYRSFLLTISPIHKGFMRVGSQ